MAIGNRVFTKRELPPKELVDKFRTLPASGVADCMNRLCALSPEIRLLSNPSKSFMAGTAVTVKNRNGDNQMIHQAMDIAGEGDVIIVSNEGGRDRSLVGENMCLYTKFRKIEGMVLDGPIRDIESIGEMDWYVYGTGTTPAGPYRSGPGEVNVPICCGGIMVNPGDIILGDLDGVIVIPRQEAAALYEVAAEFVRKDIEKTKNAVKGISDRTWVKELLDSGKIEVINAAYRDEV